METKCCGQPFGDTEVYRLQEEVQRLNIQISTLTVANQQLAHQIQKLEEDLKDWKNLWEEEMYI